MSHRSRKRPGRRGRRPSREKFGFTATACFLSTSASICNGFTTTDTNICRHHHHARRSSLSPLQIYAPRGSGYVRGDREDDITSDEVLTELNESDLEQISPRPYPRTYEPSLEYPGTMRPGRTPENMPYHDLPNLGITDPDPVPWPHFQEIEWHHKWEPPHEQALAMEEFIEVQGRWASVEDEAEMRMGMRRGVRERRELEEGLNPVTGKAGGGKAGGAGEQMVIMDDDDEEEEDDETGGRRDGSKLDIGLGEGVEALLKDVAAEREKAEAAKVSGAGGEGEADEEEESDDFLDELGLGDDEDDDEGEEEGAVKMEAGSDEGEDEGEEGDGDDDDFDFDLGFDLEVDGDEGEEDEG